MKPSKEEQERIDAEAARWLQELEQEEAQFEADMQRSAELQRERYKRLAQTFEYDGNPLYAMRSFLEAYEMGEMPPANVMAWLARGFRHYEGGKKDLNDLLGTTGSSNVPLREYKDKLMHEIWLLREVFAIKQHEAAGLVEDRLIELSEADPDNLGDLANQYALALKDSAGRVKTYDGSLNNYFSLEFGAPWRERKMEPEVKKRAWTKEARERFRAMYPDPARRILTI